MIKKQSHPARDLFDYVKGDATEQAARAVEAHLADCQDCSRVAGMVRAIRESEIPNLKSEILEDHPKVSELAAFFYGQSHRAKRASTAAHIALCRSCADQIAVYARAEQAACATRPSETREASVPAAAWNMIDEWEESHFAKARDESQQSDQDLLARLSGILSLRKDELRKQAGQLEALTGKENCVSVIIVDQTARFLGVEMFERMTGPEGESLLRHTGEAERFDNKPFHALLDFGEEHVVMITETIHRDSVRLQKVTRPNTKLQRADYFIIEGGEGGSDH